MSYESTYAAFLDRGHQAMCDQHFAQAVIFLGQAMLAGQEIADVAPTTEISLGGYFDRRLAAVTQIAELAMPRDLPTTNAERLRAERLLVGKKNGSKMDKALEPDLGINGLRVAIRYPFGGVVTSISIWRGDKKDILNTVEDNTSHWEEADYILESRQIAGLMHWAIDEGSVIPKRLHGKKLLRDRAHAVNLFTYNALLGWMT